MKQMLIVVGILALVALVLVVPACGTYNRLVTLDETANNAWANVESVLQRRYDLIPNLVNTVKGFAAQEQEVLTEITRLRSQWGEAKTPSEQVAASGMLESALGRLMVVVERYPDLKSNQNFLALQDELAGTENRIAVERRRYNEAVRRYNIAARKFPEKFYANLFGFEPRDSFDADEGAASAPRVEF